MNRRRTSSTSLNWVKAIFSYGFQLRWNNFSRLSFWQWFFNVVGILLVLKKGEALLSPNICFHQLFRARTRVVLKKVFQTLCSFISFHTHSGKVVEFRAIIFLGAWSFADFKSFIFQTFGSLLFFSHISDCNLPPLSQVSLLSSLTTLSGRTIHHHCSGPGLQCCKHQWLSRARIF